LSSAANEATTWDNAPSVETDFGEFILTEGSSTLIESFACPAGETVAFEMSAVDDTYLYYFQDWNPSPLGLYITVC
jgi:Ubiquitin 3 binding protein But2 C-terminal domain